MVKPYDIDPSEEAVEKLKRALGEIMKRSQQNVERQAASSQDEKSPDSLSRAEKLAIIAGRGQELDRLREEALKKRALASIMDRRRHIAEVVEVLNRALQKSGQSGDLCIVKVVDTSLNDDTPQVRVAFAEDQPIKEGLKEPKKVPEGEWS